MLIRLRLRSGGRGLIRWLRHEWAEINYAQRRLFEIKTGLPVLTDAPTPDQQSLIDELEALYSLPSRQPWQEGQ
jgi:hypothetical protein